MTAAFGTDFTDPAVAPELDPEAAFGHLNLEEIFAAQPFPQRQGCLMSTPYILTSLDVGGSADPAALVVLHVSKPERITKARVLHLSIKNPVVTPVMHIDFVQQAMTKIVEKFGPRIPVRYVVDVQQQQRHRLPAGQRTAATEPRRRPDHRRRKPCRWPGADARRRCRRPRFQHSRS